LAKKIAIVLQTPRDRHSSVFLTYAALSAELTRRGHAISVLTPEDFPWARRFAGRLTPLVLPVSVAIWMRRHRTSLDIVVFHSYAGWLAEAAGATGRATVIVSFHGIEPLYHRALLIATSRRLSRRYRFLQERLMPMFLRAACRKASRVTCLSREERLFLIEHGYATGDRIVTVAHGVHDRFFVDARPERPVRTLLFVAQWLPMKGIDTLRAAFTDLARRHADLRLVCAGTLFPAADVTAAFPGDIRERVIVFPRVDQQRLAEIYRDADIFVFPSNYEGFAVAVLEAMAAALPIAATATGVAGDALVDRESAMIVPPRDPSALVRALDALIADEALRARVSSGARAAAESYREAARVSEWADALTAMDPVS
jgi:glycosyltransferase involved in cell wall biosynthesis